MWASVEGRGTPRVHMTSADWRWWSRSSVRTRITLLASLIVAVTLLAGSYGLLATLKHSLISNGDVLSRAQAVDLAAQAADGSLTSLLSDVGEDSVAQVVSDDGAVLAASSGLTGQGPIGSLQPLGAEPQVRTLRGVPDDSETEDYRVWALGSTTPDGAVTVFVGTSLESLSEAVSTLRQSLLVGIPLLLAVLALTTRLLVGRALRPVEDIRAEVAAISDTALHRRVSVPANADEIGRLALTMNGMLDRLEAAAERQRDFIADASHELQSPLTAFRAQLEVALAHPQGLSWPRLADDLLADSDRMERLVHDLLFLAKEDASDPLRLGEPVDLEMVVLEEVTRLSSRIGVVLDTRRVSPAPIQGSRQELTRLVRNVLENAVRYAESRVTIELEATGKTVLLTVTDDGPGVPPEQSARIFERFARLEGARARSDGGTGLGLAIARSIAERHGGTISLAASSRDTARLDHSGTAARTRPPPPDLSDGGCARAQPQSDKSGGGARFVIQLRQG